MWRCEGRQVRVSRPREGRGEVVRESKNKSAAEEGVRREDHAEEGLSVRSVRGECRERKRGCSKGIVNSVTVLKTEYPLTSDSTCV